MQTPARLGWVKYVSQSTIPPWGVGIDVSLSLGNPEKCWLVTCDQWTSILLRESTTETGWTGHYVVNKPLRATDILEDLWPRLKDEQLAEKRCFMGNCEIVRTIFQPCALSSNTPASQKGVDLFYNPLINFYKLCTLSPANRKNPTGIITV